MPKQLLDTSVLIKHWRDRGGSAPADKTIGQAASWGKELVALRQAGAILTPIYIEFVGGTLSAHELDLARAYLGEFTIVDKGKILADDWKEARRLAERVRKKSPKEKQPSRRQLGDCLVRAIANRLRYQVVTHDRRFPS